MADPTLHAGEPHGGAHAHTDPDPELSLSGIVWTAAGVVAVTAVSMVLMWWLGGGLISRLESAEEALTPAEVRRAEAVRAAGEERLATGERPGLPGLTLPADAALPPEPRLETTPSGNLDRLRAGEEEVLERWGWADEAAGTVHVPIDRAIELVVAGALPAATGTTADEAPADDALNDEARAGDAGTESSGEEVRDAA